MNDLMPARAGPRRRSLSSALTLTFVLESWPELGRPVTVGPRGRGIRGEPGLLHGPRAADFSDELLPVPWRDESPWWIGAGFAAGNLKGGHDGQVIVPGHPEQSLLVKLIRHEGPANDPMPMPPKSKFSDADIATVEQWVKAGAVMPSDSATNEDNFG